MIKIKIETTGFNDEEEHLNLWVKRIIEISERMGLKPIIKKSKDTERFKQIYP